MIPSSSVLSLRFCFLVSTHDPSSIHGEGRTQIGVIDCTSGLLANERQGRTAPSLYRHVVVGGMCTLFSLSANHTTVLIMTASKNEEVAALEALRDSSAELVQYLDNINGKMLQMNHQNERAFVCVEGGNVSSWTRSSALDDTFCTTNFCIKTYCCLFIVSLRVLDNWSSVIAISKMNGDSAAAASSAAAAGKPHVEKALVRTSP